MMPEAKGRWPIHLEPKNPTMDKKLAITVCPNGALVTRDQNPNHPYTPKEVARQTIAAYHEGASEVHFHARDEYGYAVSDAGPYIETAELILKECPDMIMCPSISITPKKAGLGLYEVETTQTMIEDLKKRGENFIQATVVTPVSYNSLRPLRPGQPPPATIVTPEKLRAEAEFLQKMRIKPEFMAHNFEGIDNVKEYLIDHGTLQKPYVFCLGPGMHKPSTRTYPDPWGMIYLINMMAVVPRENAVIGASIGGRNWLSMTVLAIMLGVDFIRVGMEDATWLYPHREELIKTSAQVVKKVAAIARELGREITTPAETRALLGIK